MVSVNVVVPTEGEERAARAPSSACLCSLVRAVTLTVQGEPVAKKVSLPPPAPSAFGEDGL